MPDTGQTISHYTILGKLGEGGMGVVYKAEDTKLGRTVALKFLPQRLTSNQPDKSRFLQEAKSASALNHPNICTIYYLEEVGTESFIVMEYVDGTTLRERTPVKSINEAVGYAIQVGEALHEAHTKGVVHRDIKADNIMLNSRNQVKVMDFGLAKIKGSLKLTRSSSTVGTLAYMAPEQVRGEEVDPRSDIFSFGVVLFEMLTGAIPFRGEHEAAVMYSVLNEDPEPVEKYRQDLPAGLVAVILRCLEKDPADRYQHADDLVSELRRIQKQSTKVSRPSMEIDRSPASVSRPAADVSEAGLAAAPVSGRVSRVSSSADNPDPGAGSGVTPAEAGGKRGKFAIIGAVLAVAVIAAGYFHLRPEGRRCRDRRRRAKDARRSSVRKPRVARAGIFRRRHHRGDHREALGPVRARRHRDDERPAVQEDHENPQGDRERTVGGVRTAGTIRWSPGEGGQSRVRVSPALIRVDDGTQVWSQSFNAVVSDVFSIQSDVASQVAGAMGVSLLTPERDRLGKKPTDDAEAYDLYLRGNEYLRRSYKNEDFVFAADMYQKAADRDPNFALAWAALSECHSGMYWFFYDHTEERLTKAKNAVDRALRIDPALPEAHMSLGYYYYWGRLDYENALSELSVALKGKPNDGRLLLGIGAVQRRQGRMKEAIASMTRAIEVDPRRSEYLYNAAQTYELLRDYAHAEDYIKRSISLSPDLIEPYLTYIRILVKVDGATLRAREAVRKASALADFPGYTPIHQLAAELEVYDGNFGEALRIVESKVLQANSNQFFYAPRTLILADIRHLMKDRQATAYYDSARAVTRSEAPRGPGRRAVPFRARHRVRGTGAEGRRDRRGKEGGRPDADRKRGLARHVPPHGIGPDLYDDRGEGFGRHAARGPARDALQPQLRGAEDRSALGAPEGTRRIHETDIAGVSRPSHPAPGLHPGE